MKQNTPKQLTEKITAETQNLIKEAQQGNKKAMQLVLAQYEDLVKDEANQLLCMGVSFEDLCQEGRIGLYNAICKYHFTKHVWFFTFAKKNIHFAILDYINRYGDLVSIPVNKKKEMVRNSQTYSEDCKETMLKFTYRSLSAPAFYNDGDSDTYESRITADNAEWWEADENGADTQLMREDMHLQLMDICQQALTIKEQEIVELYCREWTSAEIASKMHLTTTRINQILLNARKKMTSYCTAA